MNIILASDHAGFALKEAVKKHLQSKGLQILDIGAHELVPEDDYPAYMSAAALKVAEDMGAQFTQGKPTQTKAIIFGGSGQGEAIVANRFPGVRAVVWYGGSREIIRLSRQHNDANILSIGARFVDERSAIEAIELWLNTPFSGEERHQRRNGQISIIEKTL